MPEDLRQVIERHHGFYEVAPYYVVIQERTHEQVTSRRIQAGFDVDVYGVMVNSQMNSSDDYEQVYAGFQKAAAAVQAHTGNFCSIEVIPFSSTVFLDTSDHLRPEAGYRIRITHSRGLDQPAEETEDNALTEIQEQLKTLGVRQGKGRAAIARH
jgi:hypothetical protein